MKKTILILLCLAGLFVACEDNFRGEMFEKKILINQNGFQEYDLNYIDNEYKDTTIAVAASGTATLDRDVVVTLAVNADTLDGYNWERYRNDKSLYFELLPEHMYSFEKEGIVIKAGTEYTTVPIRFYLDRFEKDKKYILPISIVSVSEYTVAAPEYSTILMNVVLANDYSGTYSLSGQTSEPSTGDYVDVRMTRTLRAEGPDQISLYASNIAENSVTREDFRIMMTVNADSTLTYSVYSGDAPFSITPAEPNLDLENPVNRYTVRRIEDSQNSHKHYVTTTFYMNYDYVDNTDPENPATYRWAGTASRTETVTVR